MESDNQNKSLLDQYLDQNKTEAAQAIDINSNPSPKINVASNAPVSRNPPYLLYVGIFFLPWIFAWFTLSDRHSKYVKVIAFGWLIFSLRSFFSFLPLRILTDIMEYKTYSSQHMNPLPQPPLPKPQPTPAWQHETSPPPQAVGQPQPTSQPQTGTQTSPAGQDIRNDTDYSLAIKNFVQSCDFLPFNLPSNLVVYEVIANDGKQILDSQSANFDATSALYNVVVNSNKPVALLLYSNDATTWRLRWTSKTKIVAILATGYHRQNVFGFDKNTPTLSTNFIDGHCSYLYEGNDQEAANNLSKKFFNKKIEKVYGDIKNGDIIVGTAPEASEVLTNSNGRTDYLFHFK